MIKLILAALIAIAPVVVLILRRWPTKDENLKEKISRKEEELEQVRTYMAKALADNDMDKYHTLNGNRIWLCKELRNLRARL